MLLSNLLSIENTHCAVKCTSKKKALEIISELAAPSLELTTQEAFEILLMREKMGSTAIGYGIGLPHGKLENDTVPATAFFLQLETAVDFEAADGQPVDLLFALFVPENECKLYHEIFPLIAQKLSDKTLCRNLRNAVTREQLYHILIEHDEIE